MSNELTAELDRLLPTVLEESDASKIEFDFLVFLGGLTKRKHEAVLGLLPGRPIFRSLPTTPLLMNLEITTPRQSFADNLCYYTVTYYGHHVPVWHIIAHLLQRSRVKPGPGLRRLTQMMSPLGQTGLFDELIMLDLDAGDSYGFVEEFEETLRTEFENVRPGFIDIALTKLISQLEDKRKSVKELFELHILKRIRNKRRRDPAQLPKIQRVAEARFIIEEIHRELFIYPNRDTQKVIDLIGKVHHWYQTSKMRYAMLGKPLFMQELSFFGEVETTRTALRHGLPFERHWKSTVIPSLTNEQFWHNMSGLNEEIPYERTEAASREAAFRQAVIVGPAILAAAVILMPVLITVAIRAPGAVIQIVRWTSGRFLLATQYSYTTYKVLGALAGTTKIVRDAYAYYLSQPVPITEAFLNGTEMVLDIFGSGTGMAPGSSPADAAETAIRTISKVAKTGISDFAVAAKTVIQKSEVEVQLLEFTGALPNANLYKIKAKFVGPENGMPKVIRTEATPVVDNYSDANKLILFSKPTYVDEVQDARGLSSASAASAKATGKSEILTAPANTKGASRTARGVEDPATKARLSKTPAADATMPAPAKATGNTSVTTPAKTTVEKGLVTPQAKIKAIRDAGKSPPAKRVASAARKTPRIDDPHNMRPDATNFDRQTAGAGGIESISFLKDPDGRYAVKIKGTLREGLYRGKGKAPPGKIKAPNYNRSSKVVSNKEAGLDANWENAHLWGPGFGDEAAAGMMKAPKKVNQWYQNEGSEGWMRDLRKLADKEGGTVEVEATAIAWDLTGRKWQPKMQVDFLKRAEYRVQLKLPNQPAQPLRVTIDVAAPPGANVVVRVDPPGATNPASLFSVPQKEP